ncbi:hypothetical protein SAMN04487897_101850 [Paenibacillus sp. yr247]|nr:hypothetical protein SAMN04487897_101850 [Paenibacillus sp. yr247]
MGADDGGDADACMDAYVDAYTDGADWDKGVVGECNPLNNLLLNLIQQPMCETNKWMLALCFLGYKPRYDRIDASSIRSFERGIIMSQVKGLEKMGYFHQEN